MTAPSIQSQLMLMHSSDGMVDLYKLDTTATGGSIYYFSPQCYQNGSLVSFGGQDYNCFPVGLETIEAHATTSALPQPTLTVSNVGGTLMAAIAGQNDLIGSTLTHWKTKASYLDAGANPDSTKFIGPQIWYLFQKQAHTNQQVQFLLTCPIDRPGLQFPIRQVMKNAGICPGLPGAPNTVLTGCSSSGTTITCASTAALIANGTGSNPTVTAGTGAFNAGTLVVEVLSSTEFTMNLAPSIALSGATITITNNIYFPGTQPYQSQY
jgi:lambda family phage minor tail protein L